MRILIYKRTHTGDPDASGRFGINGCMGRIRGFAFDAVIGVGGVSKWPTQEGIARKINWVGRNPQKIVNPQNPYAPLLSFQSKDFRLFEHQGPLLEDISPLLADKVYNSKARFFLDSLSPKEQEEARRIIHLILNTGTFNHLVLIHAPWADSCRRFVPKSRC